MSDSLGIGWGGKFITTDARNLLRELGHSGIDGMTVLERRLFQRRYLDRKTALERSENDYITDRSFVDVAAYWIEYNGLTSSADDDFVAACQKGAMRYDAHFYFPVGLVSLESDGFRSVDTVSRVRVDSLIQSLTSEWGVHCIHLDIANLDQRAARVIEVLEGGGK